MLIRWATKEEKQKYGFSENEYSEYDILFEDMPTNEMEKFMSEVQRVGRALRKVTGAVKNNYEMHSNTGAHLHIHLCPRYLDDDFPGKAIDLSCPSDPSPYEIYDEYL